MFTDKTILVAPLDWGLGHASRVVPLVALLSQKNRVVICSAGITRNLLASYFPQLEHEEIPSCNIRYSRFLPQWLKVLQQLPSLFRTVSAERKVCDNLVKKHGADVTISDNRYGFYTRGAISVFITHQLRFKFFFAGSLVTWLQARYLRRFIEIWVPDHEDTARRLSGELGSTRRPVRYIGPQSALSMADSEPHHPIDVLLLLSGPEPQRTILEQRFLKIFSRTGKKTLLVRGTTVPVKCNVPQNISVVDLAAGPRLRGIVEAADIIVCRSGYSTLMDMYLLRKQKLILVPTPGQPEQRYLAVYWKKKFGAKVFDQRMPDDRFPEA